MITILGPTASGKTSLAVKLAYELDAEIISADSRQVYRGMDIGTGKDLSEYTINETKIPYHLIDIVDAGYKYNLFEFHKDCMSAYKEIKNKGKRPILCGGTGLYIESVLKGYRLQEVPENEILRKNLEEKNMNELISLLASYKKLHNKTDIDSKKRIIRAIEIEEYYKENPISELDFPAIPSIVLGIDIDRDLRREKISKRLYQRMEEGMIEEVQQLLDKGISPENLIYYGLEYKFVTLFLTKQLSYKEMISNLEIAIHQFAKRQMTWFRGMERRGITIHWIENNVEKALEIINQHDIK